MAYSGCITMVFHKHFLFWSNREFVIILNFDISGFSNGVMNGVSNGTSNGIKISNGGSAMSNGQDTTEHEYKFLQPLVDLMVSKVLEESRDRNSKVVEFKHPKELEKLMDLSLNKPTSDERLLEICDDVIRYSVKTGKCNIIQLFVHSFSRKL